ncbi:DEAD/DEAH box helicase [Arthrobacter sp. Soc17.1.1.1]|uniref:DEAD/DEAH box helicase n=1 Tax=Arthrobacter sp. Soc17.1.1.1 TaxID=3121277 RepID=UPI002FE48B16
MSDPAAAFERLHRRVQTWIWEQKWQQLRPAQAQAVDPILAADTDVIISAATASGKTEAAWLPILSALASAAENGPVPAGVKALYISPLKALINDQYERLSNLAEHVEVPVHRRHGDVTGAARKTLRESPDGLLLITPESLEALFITQGTRIPALLHGLQYIVVDELHSFIGTERGAQLQSLLHRVELAVRRKVPRIGLSATLSDLSVAADFLRPDRALPVCLIGGTDDDRAELRMQLRGYLTAGTGPDPEASSPGDEEETQSDIDKRAIAEHLFRNLRGRDNLVFANSRANVETYADLLQEISEHNRVANEFFPHHGNLSKEFREDVESKLRRTETPATAICTSTLEMGIDIGSADTVAQIGSPGSVSALRQRLGRSGRRNGPATLRLYVSEQPLNERTPPVDQLRTGTFETLAIVELLLEKWYEPPNTSGLHLSTLIQQVLSVIAQHGGAQAAELFSALCQAGPFRHVDQGMFIQLLRTLGSKGILTQASDGTLLPGRIGERLVNHYSFYSAFQTAEEYRLVASGRTLGSIPIDHPVTEGSLLIFAGRRWRVLDVDLAGKVINLAKASGGRPPTFTGAGARIADGIRRRMQRLYENDTVPAYLDHTGRLFASQGREAYRRLGLHHRAILPWGDDTLLFPWAGDRIMNTLHVLLSSEGIAASQDGVALNCRKISPAELAGLLHQLAASEQPTPTGLAQTVLVKTQDKHDVHLNDDLLTHSYAASSLDIPGAWSTLQRLAQIDPDIPSGEKRTGPAKLFRPSSPGLPVVPGKTPFAVIDVETTGFSPHRHRVVEITIIRLNAEGVREGSWTTLINPYQPTGPSHIHGITSADIADAPGFADVLNEIAAQLSGAVVVAHNAAFDLSFLTAEFERAGLTAPAWPVLCTMQLSRYFQPGVPVTLAAVCQRLGIDTGNAHTASADAAAAAEILRTYLQQIADENRHLFQPKPAILPNAWSDERGSGGLSHPGKPREDQQHILF